MLRLSVVHTRYGERAILRGITLRIPAGSITLAAGANGAGKSTLLRAMAGLCRLEEGRITHALPPGSIAYLDHQPCVYPDLTALENLRFRLRCYRLPSQDSNCRALLARFRLEARADEKAATFSSGMLQRLSLAALFLTRPALILLDEADSGLDEQSLAHLRQELAHAKAAGSAIVRVSQQPQRDLSYADHGADYGLTLDQGRIQPLAGLPLPPEAAQ